MANKSKEVVEKPYSELRMDVLMNIADHYGLDYNKTINKENLINLLQGYERDSVTYETTEVKRRDGWWIVGVDTKNSELLNRLGKMVEKKDAVNLQIYYDHRIHYKTREKIT